MRQTKIVIFTLMLWFLCIPASAKLRCTPIYIFGTAASFNDSIVFVTEIQVIDSAWIDDKTQFLVQREEYSNQLRSYMNSLGYSDRTCLVSYSTKQKKILKKYATILKQFKGTSKKPKSFDFRDIDEDEFHFTPAVVFINDEVETSKKPAKPLKASKEKKKKKEEKMRDRLDNKRRSNKGQEDDGLPPAMPPRR